MTRFVRTGVVVGVEGQLVCVEANLRPGIPYFDLVGLAGTALKEARVRVEQAVRSSGLEWPRKRIVLNLAPAELRKEGSALDLALAVACLAEEQNFDAQRLDASIFLGELSLDGRLRSVRGVLPIVEAAKANGATYCIVPADNASEAALVPGIEVIACTDLKTTCHWLQTGDTPIIAPTEAYDEPANPARDWSEIRGQPQAKRAAEIALAGGHNLLLTGPPGTGKTLLARVLPTLLPPLQGGELLDVLRVRSVVEGCLGGSLPQRPFRAPHHSISSAGLVGGGNPIKPGEVTIAHGGILFLDELSEFPRSALECLRQPLEDRKLTMTRAGCRVTFPANVLVIAASNPCPCGHYGSSVKGCSCAPSQVARYQSKISGPMLDRIDLQVRMDRPSANDVLSDSNDPFDRTEAVRARISKARAFAVARQGCINGELSSAVVATVRATRGTLNLLRRSSDQLGLSPRVITRVLKVARSIADLAACADLQPEHLAEAFDLRTLEWGSLSCAH